MQRRDFLTGLTLPVAGSVLGCPLVANAAKPSFTDFACAHFSLDSEMKWLCSDIERQLRISGSSIRSHVFDPCCGKTSVVSLALPAWYADRVEKDFSVLALSFTAAVAKKHDKQTPYVKRADRSKIVRLSIGSALTGMRPNLIILDDVITNSTPIGKDTQENLADLFMHRVWPSTKIVDVSSTRISYFRSRLHEFNYTDKHFTVHQYTGG